ncbi:hypothetical protein NESM_000567900 [Novymonas esmeraldas]|uniref:Uncharacterized protein n=1 Tax=Novymonas esmeraldas TaxID=1808958 RepID=A0AAW0EQ56_9TRYP
MLRASFLLSPGVGDDTVAKDPAAPAELLSDVYLCVSSPPVAEDWVGWPSAAHVLLGSTQLPICGCGRPTSSPAPAAVPPPVAAVAPTTASTTPAVAHDGAATLDAVCRSYEAVDERSGGAFVQVYAVGPHALLSPEAKAMIAACCMTALRSQLSSMLVCSRLPPEQRCGRGAVLDASTATLLSRCCRPSAVMSPAPPHSASVAAHDLHEPATAALGQSWTVTWTPELVRSVVASLSPDMAGWTLRVVGCAAALRSSLHFGVRARLLRDAAGGSGDDNSGEGDAGAAARRGARQPRCTEVSVQLTACATATSHPLDVRRAVELTRAVYDCHIGVAHAHAEDGTDAFQRLVRCGGRDSDAARVAYAEALRSYQDSAVHAQGGVVVVLSHDVAAQCGSAAVLLPLSASEERSRAHAAAAGEAAGAAALHDHISVAARMRSAPAYVQQVLLRQAWTSDDAAVNAFARIWADRLSSDEATAPARAATQWRSSLPTTTHAGDVEDAGQTTRPTPLQWVLYTARRQLVVAVANRAQVILTGQRLGVGDGVLSTPSATRAVAEQCVKALPLARGLLDWQCPWPAPVWRQQRASVSAEAVTELLWTLRMVCKLQWRASQLYGAAGDVAEQRRQQRALRDEVQRWQCRRRMHTTPSTASAPAACAEDVVGHVDDGRWAVLLGELSAMLPPPVCEG